MGVETAAALSEFGALFPPPLVPGVLIAQIEAGVVQLGCRDLLGLLPSEFPGTLCAKLCQIFPSWCNEKSMAACQKAVAKGGAALQAEVAGWCYRVTRPKMALPCSALTLGALCPGCCDINPLSLGYGRCSSSQRCQKCIQAACATGGNKMACSTTHNVTSKVTGPGMCCKALAASGQAPAVGVRVAATDSKGKCVVCEIKASTSRKHPGQLVFKRGKGGALCPTSTGGCCILQTAAQQAA